LDFWRHQAVTKNTFTQTGFLTRLSTTKGKIVGEPSIDPAFERTNPGDSFGSQQQRHTGAGRFLGSPAAEKDVAIPGNLPVTFFDRRGYGVDRDSFFDLGVEGSIKEHPLSV
jgi:hypothetical protein